MPRLAVRAIVIEQGNILLSKYCDGHNIWYVLPGGGVHEGETIEEAFARETKEECGNTLPFLDVVFSRDVIADRQPTTTLASGYHQVEINIKSHLEYGTPISIEVADKHQVDVVWLPLENIKNVEFHPSSLKENFITGEWAGLYYGECS
jgi:8-oxo-dGTP diphosphatase